MPRIVLASALARWVRPAGDSSTAECVLDCAGSTVAQVLEGVFARYPNLRGYVLDEQGGVRHHLALFVDGAVLRDKRALDRPVRQELYVMQALSGG